MNIRTAAAPIAAVAIQPRIMIDRPAVKAPITDFFETSRMITTIRGTATTPLMTVLQLQFLCGMVVGETANPGDFSSEFELRIAFRKSDLSLLT
jgi:hypothetical protein